MPNSSDGSRAHSAPPLLHRKRVMPLAGANAHALPRLESGRAWFQRCDWAYRPHQSTQQTFTYSYLLSRLSALFSTRARFYAGHVSDSVGSA